MAFNNFHSKQYKKPGNKRLLILQSYVFKPDILGMNLPIRDDRAKIKLPIINNSNHNRNAKSIESPEEKQRDFFSNKANNGNYGHNKLKNMNLKKSLQNLKLHKKNSSEYLNRKSFHKTKFIINKEGSENINHLKNIFKDYINYNKFYKNEEICNFPEYEKTAILNKFQLKYSEKLDEDQSLMIENYGWPIGNIKKNRLFLENLFLKRLEMKEKSEIFKINNTIEDE